MKYRIKFRNAKETEYSYIEEDCDENCLTEGEWTLPFPNTSEESTAYGLQEALLQSDYCPIEFYECAPNYIKVEKVN